MPPTPQTLCAAAAAAYSAPPTFVVAGDVHVVLSEVDGVIVVSPRGTEPADWRDWVRDFNARPMDGGPLGICHSGFLSGAQAAIPDLLTRLPADKPVALGGHSLGGAIAIDLTALLVVHGITPLLCTTFGAPAVSIGDALSRLIAHVPGDRFHCGDDPVPFVPPYPYEQDRALTRIGRALLDPIADHMIARYADALALAPA